MRGKMHIDSTLIFTLTDLLLPPAERGVVEVSPDADHHAGAIEEEPGQH